MYGLMISNLNDSVLFKWYNYTVTGIYISAALPMVILYNHIYTYYI